MLEHLKNVAVAPDFHTFPRKYVCPCEWSHKIGTGQDIILNCETTLHICNGIPFFDEYCITTILRLPPCFVFLYFTCMLLSIPSCESYESDSQYNGYIVIHVHIILYSCYFRPVGHVPPILLLFAKIYLVLLLVYCCCMHPTWHLFLVKSCRQIFTQEKHVDHVQLVVSLPITNCWLVHSMLSQEN